jgi:hypothetical protein
VEEDVLIIVPNASNMDAGATGQEKCKFRVDSGADPADQAIGAGGSTSGSEAHQPRSSPRSPAEGAVGPHQSSRATLLSHDAAASAGETARAPDES